MNSHDQRVSAQSQYPMKGEAWIREKFGKITQGENSYVLVSVNIKNFKYINLKYGWEQGNKILNLIYHALLDQLTAGEYVAHCFADHFVMLLHSRMFDTRDEDAHAFIQAAIAPFVDEMFEIKDDWACKNIYASLGIYPVYLRKCTFYEAFEIAELFRKEDKSIKQRTYSINYYTDLALEKYLHKYELQISTANALQKGEYQVYIQPKVALATGKIVGGEALLRRFDAEGKAVPLYEFLPILNQEGYIRKVDWFVFETTCEKIASQSVQRKPIVPISFNISKDFFYDVFMLDNYINTYQKYHIEKEYIEFELMETISLDDTSRMIEVIKQFKQAGFKCSLDDFGNGYSSFGVLLNADFDYIKLDRIFFINPLDEANKRILKGVIDILKSLDFKIVAEGVETKEYVDYLAQLGCDIIQGYYYYRPMPLGEFMLLLNKQEETENAIKF